MHEAKTNLSKLVKQVEEGEEVVIERNGKPVARLTRAEEQRNNMAAIYGIWKGQVWMADDFDELPEDMAEAFGMR